MKRKDKKGLFSVILLLLIVGISIGYAFLSKTLSINGTSRISNNSWDIHFDNIVVTDGSVLTPSPNQAATITPANPTEVTYIVTLDKPGDFYEFTVDAVNAGTIDGMIGSIVSKLNNVEIDDTHPLPVYLDYSVTYSDGIEIDDNHLLKAGETETYKIRLEFKRDIENEELPTSFISNSFSFGTSYLQSDSSAISDFHTKWVYRSGTDGEEYNTFQEARDALAQYAELSEVYIALKEKIVSETVVEKYIVFEITNDMVANNPTVIPGIYEIRTEVNENDIEESPVFNANKQTLLSAIGNSGCSFYSRAGSCYIYNNDHSILLNIYINKEGTNKIEEAAYCMTKNVGLSFTTECGNINDLPI